MASSHTSYAVPEQPMEELLGEFPLFAALPPKRRAALKTLLTAGVYAPGEKIFAYGDLGDHLFFVCWGQVTFSLTDNVDHKQDYGAIGAGGCFGEVAVFSGVRPPADGRVARLMRVLAAPWFLISQTAACGLWMAFSQKIDPFPYPFLSFFLGAEALIATFLILRYQNREEESDRVRDAALDRAVDGISQRLDDILKQVKR